MTESASPARPWSRGGMPPVDELRALAVTLTVDGLAQHYNVDRTTVEYYLRRAGLAPTRPRLSYKDMVPWQLAGADAWHGIPAALRAWSKERQNVPLTQPEESRLRQLRDHLAKHDRVVHYTRDGGWALVPRDPKRDDPALPILRP